MPKKRRGDARMNKSDLTSNVEKQTLELHRCIKHGDMFSAKSLIQKLCMQTRRKLTRGNKKLGTPPAIFDAIGKGDIEVLRFLVNRCNADVDEKPLEGTDTIYGWQVNSQMTALEFALSRQLPDMFEFLLCSGATPTSLVKDKNMIVRMYMSSSISVKALQMLADHGADFNTSDDQGHTCLMHAVENVSQCRFLLGKGVNVNAKNNKGETALHIAVEKKYSYSVKALVAYGADPYCRNDAGYDPLHLACLNCREAILKFLLETVSADANRQIESYQLLGNTLLSNRFVNSAKILNLWGKAVELRLGNQIQTPAAKIDTPSGVVVEATSISELDALRCDRHLLLLQSVVLAHKIFGPAHDQFFKTITSIAEEYFSDDSLDRWMQMQIYCLHSSVNHLETCSFVEKSPLAVNWKITDLVERKVTLDFSLIYDFMEAVVQVVQKSTKLEEMKIFRDMIFSAIYLYFAANCQNRRKLDFKRLVCSAVTEIGKQRERTVLIDALSHWFPNYHRFVRSSDLVTMLLECGADVDERDGNECNVAQFLLECRNSQHVYDLRQIATKCVEHGLHLDAKIARGNTTAQCLQQLGIRIEPPISLMCLAARVIRQCKIPVQGILPKILIDFVAMH